MLSLIFTLLTGFTGPSFDELPIQEVEQYAQQAAKNIQPNFGQKIHILTANRKEMTPLGSLNASLKNCIVVINTNPDAWRMWGRFLNNVDRKDWSAIIEASTAHEIGHCEERSLSAKLKEQSVDNAGFALVQGGNPAKRDTMKSDQAVSRQLSSELYADVYAHLYLKKFMTDKAALVEKAWHDGREEYSSIDPDHATSEYVEKVKTHIQAWDKESPMNENAWRLRELSLSASAKVGL